MDHKDAAMVDRSFPPQATEASGTLPHVAEPSGTVPYTAEDRGNIPQPADHFRIPPQAAASFSRMPHFTEKTEHHTATVREVVRLFEDAGVPRSERTIVSWCQVNALGASKLDAFFDPAERRYYITPESASRAIQEEISKAVGIAPRDTTRKPQTESPSANRATESADAQALDLKIRDLEILSRAKDMYIEKLESERTKLLNEVIEKSRHVGQLETKLLQLGDGSFSATTYSSQHHMEM